MTRRHVVTATTLLALAVGTLSACARPLPDAAPAAEVRHEPSGSVRHVVLVTIDGLLPDSYLDPDAHGLRVPTLRRFVREGGHGDGTRSVFPSLTYPAHTSIATGVTPQKHGIVSNRAFDPLDKNAEAWYWYAEDIKAPPLWELARRRGLRTALINWPVSVGAQVDWLVPEYWRSREPEDLKLVRALSTPGLLESVQHDVPDLFARFTPPEDSATRLPQVASARGTRLTRAAAATTPHRAEAPASSTALPCADSRAPSPGSHTVPIAHSSSRRARRTIFAACAGAGPFRRAHASRPISTNKAPRGPECAASPQDNGRLGLPRGRAVG